MLPSLRRLRSSEIHSDCDIFEIVKSFVEPFPMLRDTLAFWRDELEQSTIRDWADDVLICMRVELWCESASRVPRAFSQRPAEFVPFISPFVLSEVVVQKRYIVTAAGVVAQPSAGSSGASPVIQLDFWDPVPEYIHECALDLSLPAPPVPVLGLWDFTSCPLRRMREHGLWLLQTFDWIGLAIEVAKAGRPCSILAAFSKGGMGVLADWLLEASQSSLGRPSLSICFTA